MCACVSVWACVCECVRHIFKDEIQHGLIVALHCNTNGLSNHSSTNELFSSHTDIHKKLTVNAPTLVPLLFDGLNWRSPQPRRPPARELHKPLLTTPLSAVCVCVCACVAVSPVLRLRSRTGVSVCVCVSFRVRVCVCDQPCPPPAELYRGECVCVCPSQRFEDDIQRELHMLRFNRGSWTSWWRQRLEQVSRAHVLEWFFFVIAVFVLIISASPSA